MVELGKRLFYRFTTQLLYIVCRLLFRLKIFGKENIPQDGAILIARHRSYWDIPLIVVALGGKNQIYFVARKSLIRENLLLAPFIKAYAIPVDRENFRKSEFRRVLKAIEEERIVGIFPEGTTKGVAAPRIGAVRFAERTGQRVLPVNIVAQGPYPPKYPFCFPKVEVWIGELFHIEDLKAELSLDLGKDERDLQISVLMMERVDRVGREGWR